MKIWLLCRRPRLDRRRLHVIIQSVMALYSIVPNTFGTHRWYVLLEIAKCVFVSAMLSSRSSIGVYKHSNTAVVPGATVSL